MNRYEANLELFTSNLVFIGGDGLLFCLRCTAKGSSSLPEDGLGFVD